MRLPSEWRECQPFFGAISDLVDNVVRDAIRRHQNEEDRLKVGVLLTDDDTIQQLNREYRHVDAPTDVLAFSMREGEDADIHPELLGDLAISVPMACRQAVDLGHSLARELGFLAVHGVLHLLGHDDSTESGARAMDDQTGDVLAALTSSDEWRARETRIASFLVGEPA